MRAVIRSLLLVASAAALVFSLGHLVLHYVGLTESYGRLLVF
jgi:hypothetical protein